MIRWLAGSALALVLLLGGSTPFASTAAADDSGSGLHVVKSGSGKAGKHKGKHRKGKHKGKHKGGKKKTVEASA